MKRILLAHVLGALLAATSAWADDPAHDPTITAPLGSAISYQGKLDKNGAPVNGNCNLIFGLFDASTGGNQIGTNVTVSNQPVSNGLFSVSLDFGVAAFNGEARWMQIQVQGPGDPEYTQLTPRQAITAAPYALHALSSTGSSAWSGDSNGINYSGGNVGIGVAAGIEAKFHVDSGTSDLNPGWFSNQNDSYPSLVTANTSANGWGFFDFQSARHHFAGKVGVGTTAPEGKLQANSSSEAAIIGKHTGNWVGVYGESQGHVGVWGNSVTGVAVFGLSRDGWGVSGDNTTAGTRGILASATDGVVGFVNNVAHIGGRFENAAPGGTALYANGVAKVKTLQILGGADIVEGFETGDDVLEPGTVVVIDERHPGELRAAAHAYDSHVAGVVSGAGGVAPGLRLGQEHVMDGETSVAMTGRVYVRCSVQNGRIRPGDLLTTSDHAGHAMRASNVERCNGAILGKAMTTLDAGTGLVLVLVNLQ